MARHGGTQFRLERGAPIELVLAKKQKNSLNLGFPSPFRSFRDFNLAELRDAFTSTNLATIARVAIDFYNKAGLMPLVTTRLYV